MVGLPASFFFDVVGDLVVDFPGLADNEAEVFLLFVVPVFTGDDHALAIGGSPG